MVSRIKTMLPEDLFYWDKNKILYIQKAISDSLPVCMVEAAQSDAFHLFVALTTGVSIAIIAKDEAGGSACDDGEATDAALHGREKRLYINHQLSSLNKYIH